MKIRRQRRVLDSDLRKEPDTIQEEDTGSFRIPSQIGHSCLVKKKESSVLCIRQFRFYEYLHFMENPPHTRNIGIYIHICESISQQLQIVGGIILTGS